MIEILVQAYNDDFTISASNTLFLSFYTKQDNTVKHEHELVWAISQYHQNNLTRNSTKR